MGMKERDKIIKGMELCLTPYDRREGDDVDICSYVECPYFREYNMGDCIRALCGDALALLKAQEPRDAIVVHNGIDRRGGLWYQCPSCKMEIKPRDRYCRSCGQAVKW